MKDNTCSIIMDLLPSYIDELTSEETNEFINKHLGECKHCCKALSEYTLDIEVSIEPPQKSKKKTLRNMRIQFIWYLFWPMLYGISMQFNIGNVTGLFITFLMAFTFAFIQPHIYEYVFDTDSTKKAFYEREKKSWREGKGSFLAQGLFWILPVLIPTLFLVIPQFINNFVR